VPKLIISRDKHVIQELELGPGRTSIGRHPHNDIVIAHQAVSARHAAIDTDADAVILEDLGSSNGTFVNGQRVERIVLRDGDQITLATYQLDYFANDFAGDTAAEAQAPSLAGCLEVINGVNAGMLVPLAKPVTTLGSPGVLVVVISRQADGYYIEHVQGDGVGTVNGEPIGRVPRLLRDGDVLDLTGTGMRFSLKASEGPAR
jgi:pSer/pThr/pTyr-binding forkhead associated (FHA) protein